jgi:hypothetical protein
MSRAISRVKWLNGEKTNSLKTISDLVLRVMMWIWLGTHIRTLRTRTEMVFEKLFFVTIQPLDPVDSPRELYYTQPPGKQQILQ